MITGIFIITDSNKRTYLLITDPWQQVPIQGGVIRSTMTDKSSLFQAEGKPNYAQMPLEREPVSRRRYSPFLSNDYTNLSTNLKTLTTLTLTLTDPHDAFEGFVRQYFLTLYGTIF